MVTLDEFFRSPSKPPAHPYVRRWKALLDDPCVRSDLQVSLEEPVFGAGLPILDLRFIKHCEPAASFPSPWDEEFAKTLAQEPFLHFEMPWDDDLNGEMLRLHIKASDPEQEALRFSLGLRGALRKPQNEFGDGFLNSVLIEFIGESDLTTEPLIAEIVPLVSAPTPRPGKKRDLCREMIADAIAGRAHELTHELGYSLEESKPILLSALARYLDRRFSITSRKRLGFT